MTESFYLSYDAEDDSSLLSDVQKLLFSLEPSDELKTLDVVLIGLEMWNLFCYNFGWEGLSESFKGLFWFKILVNLAGRVCYLWYPTKFSSSFLV